MKKLYFLLTFFFLSFISFSQSCLPEGIIFTTQEQIDSFQVNYPGCTVIEGNVTILGNDILNLAGLNAVTMIRGDLNIYTEGNLTDLTGLDNVTSIGGSLNIEESSLSSLTGLDGLTTIDGALWIKGNNSLVNLTGLEELNYVDWNLLISENSSLTSLAGLNNLDSIGQGFLIHKNDALTDLTDLHNLSYIGISLKIDSNEVLEDLDGLDNIKTSPIQYLWIYDNHKLSSCSVKFVCDAIAAYYLEIEIHDNAEGCNTLDEVNEKCIIGLDECDLTENIFTLSPNPSSTQITIQTITSSSKFQISIFNLNSQEVIHREVAQSKTVIDISTLPAGVYFVRMTAESAVSIQKFIKID